MTVINPPAWPYELIRELNAHLTRAGLGDLKQRIDEEVGREAAEEAAVVIVGATNTGKSSLINALVGYPNLVPVAHDVATNVHIVVRHGPPGMTVHFDAPGPGQEDGRHFDVPDVGSWATVAHNPDNAKGVKAIEVTVESPLLATGLALVDTPGVGGIDAAHGRVTLAALAGADALVFLADADRPLIQPELDFLEKATERIRTVIFVFSKIDVKPGWRKIMDEDQKLLREHAPKFADAPFIGVSSLLEETAAAWRLAGRPPAAIQQLQDESGLPGLRTFLANRVAEKVHFVRRSMVLQLCGEGIELLEGRDHAVTQAGPELMESLKAEEARLAALESAAAIWPQRVNDSFMRLRGRLQAEISDLAKKMGQRYGDKDLEPFLSKPDALRDSLIREINAIGVEVSNGLRVGVEAIEADIIGLVAPAMRLTPADLPSAGDINTVEAELLGSADRFQEGQKVRNVRLGYSAIAQGMSFSGIGHLAFLAFLGISSASFFGLGIGFGALLAVAEARGHRKQAKLQEVRPFVQEALQAAQQKLPLELGDAILEVQRRLESETRKRIKEEQAEAVEARKRCQAMLQATPEDRAQAVADAQAHLAVIENLRARCEWRQNELAQLIAGTATLAIDAAG